jgi:hypothetical protein
MKAHKILCFDRTSKDGTTFNKTLLRKTQKRRYKQHFVLWRQLMNIPTSLILISIFFNGYFEYGNREILRLLN